MDTFRKKKDPKQERSRDTVDAILKAVAELVDTKDAESLTTTRIAERAGVSVGSLYQYFPGKDAIFASLIEWYLRKEANIILEALNAQDGKPIESAVDEMLERIIAIRTRNLRLERTLIAFFSKAGDFAFLKALDERMIADLDGALTAAAARGAVKRGEATAFLLFHAIRSTFLAASLEKPELYEKPGELRENLRKVVLALIMMQP